MNAPAAAKELSFVHRFEPATDAAAPALLLLHGTGGDESDLIPLGRMIARGAALLSPRGKVLEGSLPRFFRRIAMGVFDQEDLAFRTEELAQFIQSACKAYEIAPERLVTVGLSNGANIAASLLLRRPEMVAGAVLLRAMVPFEPKPLPQLAGRPVLLQSGMSDTVVPIQETEELAQLLRSAGANVTLHWEKAGHELTQADIQKARDWLARFYQVKVFPSTGK